MDRADEVMEELRKMIEKREKPSARKLSTSLEMPEPDVHRCLNVLERDNRVKTHTQEMFGKRHRIVAVKR